MNLLRRAEPLDSARQSTRALIERTVRLLLLLFVWCGGFAHAGTDANEAVSRGLDWLQGQVQGDGSLKDEAFSPAGIQQLRAEAFRTLRELGRQPGAAQAVKLAEQAKDSSELLARSLLASPDHAASNAWRQTLLGLQGSRGGYYASADFDATVADTSWVLRALGSKAPGAESAVSWLIGMQAANGAWPSVDQQHSVYVSALALSALRPFVAEMPLVALATQRASAYLLSQRQQDGSWASSLWLSALVYEALHDFVADPAFHADMRAWLLAQRGVRDDWAHDSFSTALALRALALTGLLPRNPSTASLSLQVRDSETGLPLSGVGWDLKGDSALLGFSGAGGQIDVSDIKPGAYRLGLSMAGYQSMVIDLVMRPDVVSRLGTVQLLRLRDPAVPGAVVSGLVVDAKSRVPLPGASVQLSGGGGQTQTDTQGRYLMAGLPSGALTLTVSKPGYTSSSADVNLAAGKEWVFSPQLSPLSQDTGGDALGCRAFGQILRATDGTPLAGALVQISGANARTTLTDSSGAFLLTELLSGISTLSVSSAGYDPVSASIQLACKNATALEFSPRLHPAQTSPDGANTAALSFVVVDASTGNPIAGLVVNATPAGQPVRGLTTDSQGRLLVDKLREGLVQIDIAAGKYEGLSLSYSVQPLKAVDLGQLRLRKASSAALLPDLKLLSVKRASAVTDPQTLQLSGSLEFQIANAGLAPVDQVVHVLAFHDRNGNAKFDAAVDMTLGVADLPMQLKPGQTASYALPVSGTLPFRDAPVHLLIDPDQQVPELNRKNNLKSSADAAELAPSIGSFKPVLKWAWDGNNAPFSGFNQVMMAPIVGRWLDTNGDGRVDSSDHPVLVFTSFFGTDYQGQGVIRALDGVTGKELLTIKDDLAPTAGVGQLALADLDGDGKPELVAITLDYRIAVYRNDGRRWWLSAPVESSHQSTSGAPLIADLDGDGHPEVVFGRAVYSYDGTLKWRAKGSYVGSALAQDVRLSIPIAADLFASGRQNLILGGSVYGADGALLWAVQDGFAGVADFDGDGIPSIALVSNGQVFLLSRDGRERWRVAIPGGGYGGPPTIADVDGDGRPEVCVAAAIAYTCYRADGSVLWSKPAQDWSSTMTGSTVFDFDGDGSVEILYADEISLKTFRGMNGETLWTIPTSSGTALEFPLVADVDADGHADMVVVTNDYYRPPNVTHLSHGVSVYQDQANSWVNTRQVWNQHAYSITNINEDLSVPARPALSWEVHNGFRANRRIEGSPRAVADLTASFVRISDRGGSSPAVLTARIGNGGALSVPIGIKIAFYAGSGANSPLLGLAATSRPLAPGEYEDVMLAAPTSLAAIAQLSVVADDDGTGKSSVADFDPRNNRVQVDVAGLATRLTLDFAMSKPSYPIAEQVQGLATVSNEGSFAKTVALRFRVLTLDGQSVAVLPLSNGTLLPAGARQVQLGNWLPRGVLAGRYQMQAELLGPDGVIVATTAAPFELLAAAGPAVQLSLQADKARYSSADTIHLRSRVRNQQLNQVLEQVNVRTSILLSGQVVWSKLEALPQLTATTMREYPYSVSAAALKPGAYQATLSVEGAAGQALGSAGASFEVQGTDVSGLGLKGQLLLPTAPVYVGDTASLGFIASNAGNMAVAALALRLRVLDPVAGQVLQESGFDSRLDVGGSYQASASWLAAGQPRNLLVTLSAQLGGTERVLAQGGISIAQRPVQLDAKLSLRPAGGGVLVFLDCEAGLVLDAKGLRRWNDYRDPCYALRQQFIDSYLSDLKLPHFVTYDPALYYRELRSGLYSQVWVLGALPTWAPWLRNETREFVNRGNALLVDAGGSWDDGNALFALGGVRVLGRVQWPAPTMTVNTSPFTPAQLPTEGAVLWMQEGNGTAGGATPSVLAQYFPSAAVSASRVDGSTVLLPVQPLPAVFGRSYGQGRVMSLGFDLINSLRAARSTPSAWRRWVGEAAKWLTPPATERPMVGGELMQLSTQLTNQGQAIAVDLGFKLPEGTQFVSASPDATRDSSKFSWHVDLALAAKPELAAQLRAPSKPGAYSLDGLLSVSRNGQTQTWSQPRAPFAVQDSRTAVLAAIQRLKAYQPSASEYTAWSGVLADINYALWFFDQARWGECIDNIGIATDLLLQLRADFSAERLSLDRLMQEAQYRWSQDFRAWPNTPANLLPLPNPIQASSASTGQAVAGTPANKGHQSPGRN